MPMKTQQTQGPTPGRARRHAGGLLLAAAVAVGLALATGVVPGDPGPELGPVQAASVANTDAGPVRCPDQWYETVPPATPFAPEVMVPTGATEVLMCSYPTLGTEPWSLGSARRNTSDVTELTDYINGLAISSGDDDACLMYIPSLRRSVVFGYPGQRAVTIHLGCPFWQRDGGTARYAGDQRKVLAYWGLSWNQH